MKIEIVNSHLVDQVWPLIVDKVARASDRYGDDMTPGEMWQACRSGNAFLIAGYSENEILVSAIVRFDRWASGSVLSVLYLGGTGLKDWLPQIVEFIKNMAKANGARQLLTQGRDGWGEVLPGVKKLRSLYVMEIEP